MSTTKTQSETKANGAANGFKVIGTRPIRPDGIDKVTGRAQYGADIHLPGTLYGKMLRSPHAHAIIKSIDTSAAEKLPGVAAVVTAKDLAEAEDKVEMSGEGEVNFKYLSDNILARDKVLYHGHPIAAVAAINSNVAEEALALIKVEYEVLPPVLDCVEAMKEGAPILLEGLRTDELGKKGDKQTNVAAHFQHKRGDLEKGFQEAAVVVERDFTTAMVHQGYIEPHASTAFWRRDGHVLVWTSTQGAFDIRNQVAELLRLPISKVRVTPTEIGGGFGGKFTAYTDVPAALLSKKSGYRPVKLVMSRTEVLQSTGPTSGSHIRVKMGADKNGKITAAQTEMIYEAGGYPGSPVGAGAGVIFAPYRLENVQIDGYDVVNNKPKTAAYRAPGGTNAAYACEAVIDELAEKLGMDPLEFRRINAAVEGDRRPDGPIHGRIGMVETVEAALNHPHYKTPLTGKFRGRGVASGFWFNGGGKSSMHASVDESGSVNLIEGSTDIGGSRASISMMLAETLGITMEDINPQIGDTETVGHNDGTGGSRVTFATGMAAYELGKNIAQTMSESLADMWDVQPDQVKFEGGVFSHNGDSLNFKEAAAKLNEAGKPIVASASVRAGGVGPGFATHIVDVEVDAETGKISILRYTATQDVGRAIHPSYVEGQIQGGVAQGIGWAINEEYFYDKDGHLLNSSLLDYRMPTALDLPMIETVLVEVPNPNHPYGVRGVGEVPIVPPAAAVANAVYHAIGVRMTELPMNPARVMQAIWSKQKA
ncbi:MAG: xanthine dehydrogenase family protein molybdopterin-binding subunit [Chloroflexi bacterium]|nr:xanthine dehydrogenase family protein molybdopterin-binding subunit [Chloroflexota bacterium]